MSRKKVICTIGIVLLALCLVGGMVFYSCLLYDAYKNGHPYDEEWIIGKTYQEVEAKYGEYDLHLNNEKNEDGSYYRGGHGYMTKQWKSGLTSHKDEYYMIFFDENGVAYRVEEGFHRPGR